MKRFFYGVLVIALSLAFLSACDDSKKQAQKEEALCTEGVDCAIVPPIQQVKCYDITKVGFEKRMPLRLPKRPLRERVGVSYAKAATLESREVTDMAFALREDIEKEEVRRGTAVDKITVLRYPDSLPTSNRVSESARNTIIETFIETYDEANGGNFYTEGELDPETEYTIAPLERTAYLFQPEGECFFIKAELEAEEEVVE